MPPSSTPSTPPEATATLRRARERIATTQPCRWGDDPLVTAIKRGQVFKALRVLDRMQETQGLDPVARILTTDAHGHHLMHLAVAYGHPRMLEALEARCGQTVEHVRHNGKTLNLLAVALDRHVSHRSYRGRQSAMADYLMDRGVAPTEETAPEPWANWLVEKRQYAAFDRMVQHPAARGWYWDVPRLVGNTRETVLASVWRTGEDRWNTVKALVGEPALDPQGRCDGVLHAMAQQGRSDDFNALREAHPHLVDTRNHKGETPVHHLVKGVLFGPGGWARRVHAFHNALEGLPAACLNRPDHDGYTPVMRLLSMSLNRSSIEPSQVKDVVGLMRAAGARLMPEEPGAFSVRTLLHEEDAPQRAGSLADWLMQQAVEEEAGQLHAMLDEATDPQLRDQGPRPRSRL